MEVEGLHRRTPHAVNEAGVAADNHGAGASSHHTSETLQTLVKAYHRVARPQEGAQLVAQ